MKTSAQTTIERRARRLLLVRRAMRGYDDLPVADKIELLLAAAAVLPKAEAEAAKQTAFTLRESETQQLAFAELLGRDDPAA